jgi:CRISPR/Cas system-associated exonuclease Cas4 (RecB family)
MTRFLEQVASYVLDRHKQNFEGIWMVFPNRRSGVFFRYYLTGQLKNPSWSPKILTINQLVSDISNTQIADKLTLIGDLYKAFSAEQANAESFDEFFSWGEILLNDFIDIDKYLAKSKDLFQNIKDLKEIEDNYSYLTPEQISAIKTFWASFKEEKEDGVEKTFLNIWKSLNKIYERFNKILKQAGYGHEGSVYRAAANLNAAEIVEKSKIKRIYFIGFNALTSAEKGLFSNLQKFGVADFIFDYANYYLDNHAHEAGRFIRENLKSYPEPKDFINKTDSNKQNGLSTKFLSGTELNCYEAASRIGQVKIIGKLLQEDQTSGDRPPHKTAIILPDESLLEPLLNSLPPDIGNINITMGYPVKNTTAYLLTEHLIELFNTAKTDRKGQTLFYYKNIQTIITHPFIKNSYTEEGKQLQKFIITHKNYTLNSHSIADHFPELARHLFNNTENTDPLQWIRNFLIWTFGNIQKDENYLEQEYLTQVIKVLNRTIETLAKLELELLPPTTFRILRQGLSKTTIPFQGEPLNGIQIAGVLETRLLDFDHVVILSMNEGVFPKSKPGASYIPYNLRKGFGLPTIDHSDAMASYYFHNLLQRAKHVDLIYSSNLGPVGLAEMNRFLYQLKYNSSVDLKEHLVKPHLNFTSSRAIKIEKSSSVIIKLNEYSDDGSKKKLSPTAINQWIDCKLKFYFRYIARLKVPDEMTEELDAAQFGSILHRAIQLIYENKSLISAELIKNIISSQKFVEDQLLLAFGEIYFNREQAVQQEELTGSLILAFETLKKYLLQILKTDLKYAPFQMIGLEEEVRDKISIDIQGRKYNITIGGTIDRIDLKGDTIRIIDYKTGKDTKSFKKTEELFDSSIVDRKRGILQVLLYSLLYSDIPDKNLSPCIYSLKDIFSSDYNPQIKLDKSLLDYSNLREEFSQMITETISEIFHPDIPFDQTENLEICKYCDYSSLCNRHQ